MQLSITVSDTAGLLIMQWVKIFRQEYSEVERDEGYWPRTKGELLEEAFELWLGQMQDEEKFVDLAGFYERIQDWPEDEQQAAIRSRYSESGYLEAVTKLPPEVIRFEGER